MPNPESFQPDDNNVLHAHVLNHYKELDETNHEEYVYIATTRWLVLPRDKREELTLLASAFVEPEARQEYIRSVLVHDHAIEQIKQITLLNEQLNLPSVEHPPILQ